MGRDWGPKRQDRGQLRGPDPGAVSGQAARVQSESVVQLDGARLHGGDAEEFCVGSGEAGV